MNSVDGIRGLKLTFLLVVLAQTPVAGIHAERVGFQFTGALQVPGTGNTNLFNKSVPKNSPITGTFSYDVPSAASGTNPAKFDHHIEGGFTLKINNGDIRLSASDFLVVVTNDFQRQVPLETVDTLDVKYDTRFTPAPRPLLFNDSPWEGIAYITLEFSWPFTTFADAELTADRPLTPGFSNAAYSSVSSSANLLKFFYISSVSAIVPPSGDYNYDGRVDFSDYNEWRKAFGDSASYADGNNDGVVDAADYVVWRDALGSNDAIAAASVPEPTSLVSAAIGLYTLATRFGRQRFWRLRRF